MSGQEERFLTTQHACHPEAWGMERDRETGLDYRGARYYDSDIARFLSLDPLAAEFASWSAYNYVLGNPIVFVDPDGKEPTGIYLDENGNYLGSDDVNDFKVYTVYGADNFDIDDFKEGGQYYGNHTQFRKDHGVGNLVLDVGEVDHYQFDFDARIRDADAMTGKTLNKSKHAQFGIIGTMELNAVLSDGTVITQEQYSINSGPYNNGPTPNHNYTGTSCVATNEDGMQIHGQTGWKVYMEDFNGRSGLRMHPDTNSPGTAGCIGVTGTTEKLNQLGAFIQAYIENRGSISINFQVPHNPNYGNEGRAVASPGE